MIPDLLTVIIAGVVIFEFVEHILFPLVWSFAIRNTKSSCGTDGMLGKVVEIKAWRNGEGRVFLEGELWRAVSCDPLRPGDKARVQEVDGLVMKIALDRDQA